jgi:bifunctional non-homologous end joining protein LigD
MFARPGVASPRPAGFIEPCLPTKSERPRNGPQWVHEVKHDGYRLMVHRNGDRVRLFTRHGYDWTERYPRIAKAMARLKITSALIDGEAVCWGPDGADFDKLHSRAHDDKAILIAFDLLELDGEDWREQPLEARKKQLRQITRKSEGLQYSEHLEGDGVAIFENVCAMGLEGIVSKRRDFPYVSGRAKCWIKVRNPASAAMRRYEEGTF